jgi:hypothetical protein
VTLDETWKSGALEDGVNLLQVRPDGADEKPVYAYGINVQSLPFVGYIHALDSDTGDQLDGAWPVETDGVPLVRSVEGEPLFVAEAGVITNDTSLRALDPTDGSLQWERSLPSAQVIPGLLYDRTQELLLGIGDGPTVTGIDTSDGSEVWSEQFAPGGTALFYQQDGDVLYVASNEVDAVGRPESATIWAVDTGESVANRERWTFSQADSITSAVPGVSDETIVAEFSEPSEDGPPDSTVVGINASDGTERWSRSRSDNLILSGGFIFHDSALYATAGTTPEDGPSDGAVLRLDPLSGDVAWEVDAGALVPRVQVDDNGVYAVTITGDAFAVNDDPESDDYGTEKWRRSLGGEVSEIGLTLRCGTLYTGRDSDGTVIAIDTDDGTILDTFTVDSGILGQVSSSRGSIWAATAPEPEEPGPGTLGTDNRVYRLDGDSPDGGPEASFTVDPASPDPGEDVTLDASGSTGDIVEYRWDVDGDGADDATTTDPTYVDSYEGTGTYEATLTVEDGDGNTDSATETVTVTEPGEGPPALPGQDNPPQDLNGDGLYRDANGDGAFTIADVQLFFQNRDSDAVRNNPAAFNFDGSDPAEVTIADVQALFQDFQDGVSQDATDN